MKQSLFVLLFLPFSHLFSQSKLTVLRAENGSPIAGANVTCNNKSLGKTNTQGILSFKTKCRTVEVSAPGFFEDEVVVDKVMESSLSAVSKQTQSIKSVQINDVSDPRALEILKKVNERYAENSPQSLDSYRYKSYEKISYDFDADSIQLYALSLKKRLDSLEKIPVKTQTSGQKKDSLEGVNVMKLMGDSKLFLWERASEFLFSKKLGEKTNILDNRIAGLNQPVYEMLALRSNRNRIPREILPENRALYRYFLTDSLDIDGRKNFVIRFRQVDKKQPVNRRKFNGYLYIDTETFGLKKIESNSRKKSEGSITSIWKPINGKWFLNRENLKIRMGSSTLEDRYKKDSTGKKTENKDRTIFGHYVYMNADYFGYETPANLTPKDFSGYTMSVKNSDGSLLGNFRTEPLNDREELTYTKIDSVGDKYKLDQKINAFSSLLRGKLRYGKFDFDVSQIFKYNLYEGVRLGAGIKLNEKFHRYISPDVYVAYGFKDHNWKYGAGIDIKTTLEKNSFFRAEFYNDVQMAGRFSENLWNFRMKFMNSGIDMNNDRFYKFAGFKFSYETDLTNALTARISVKKDEEEAGFDYNYAGLGNQFDNFATQVSFKYSPKSKNIMTPAGKYTFDQNYPEIFANYEQGISAAGGDLTYSRIDVLFQHRFKTKVGTTGIRTYGGLMLGDAPIWHKFAMNGLGSTASSFNFNVNSFLGFATMEAGKYYTDRFAGLYLNHQIPLYFRTFGKRTTNFAAVYHGAVGNMNNTELHQFEFEKLNHLYQEVGLETNNFLGTPFNLGLFYRVGHYATSNFSDNFAVQLKLNILGF